MGYSMGARAKTATLKKQMLAFLSEHYRCWPQVMGEDEKHWWFNSSPPKGSPDLSYDDAKLALGFDHSGLHGWERLYLMTVCRWIALQVGPRKKRFSKDTITPNVLPAPAPYMTYDGDDHWPVIVRTVKAAAKLPKRQHWCAFSPLGLPTGPRRFHRASMYGLESMLDEKELKKMFEAIEADLAKANYADLPGGTPRIRLHEDIRLKHLKPNVMAGFAQVRAEMKRLDKLWRSVAL